MGQGLASDQRSVLESVSPDTVHPAMPFSSAIPSGTQGMDVSGWQADPDTYSVSQVNWAQHWQMGARFVYTKATEGDYFVDASRTSHLKGAKAVGMLTGGYHFALPNQSSAIQQADFFVQNGGGWTSNGSTLPPLLDIENNQYSWLGNSCYNMTQSAMVSWIKSFSSRVKALTGRLPMIYTNYYWWQECTGNSKEFANQNLHIAAYGASSPWIPGGWKDYDFWQFSDSGPFSGDSNVFNGTLNELKLFAKSSTSSVETPSIQSTADVVAADDSGTLWNYPATDSGSLGLRQKIGSGWIGLRSIHVIDWNADGVLDIVGQWFSGTLRVYKGLPTGGFASPNTLAGEGWGSHQIAIGLWLNSSNYPQIVSKSETGVLQQWPNTSGNFLGSPKQIGQGWGKLDVKMIDFDGDGKQDLLAQDASGSMIVYRSNGNGAFVYEARKNVATGWSKYTSLSTAKGFTSSTARGLIRRSATGVLDYIDVAETGKFGASKVIGSGWNSYLIAGAEHINLVRPPLQPAVPQITGGSGKAMATVPKSNSGDAATSLTIIAKPSNGRCTVAAGSGSCTISGLTNGTAYTFQATAHNAAGSSPSSGWSQEVIPTHPVERLSGSDRYETAAAVSRDTYAPGVKVVYIANGTTFPDALAGAAAAGTQNSPVLLTKANALPTATINELKRLKPQKIVVLGSNGVINIPVEASLKTYSPSVIRLSGLDRYETTAAVSRDTYAPGVKVAYIANGTTFPDALAGAAAAGTQNSPVLLTKANALPTATINELQRLKPQKIVVLGSNGVINIPVEASLKTYSPSVIRLSGLDRYETTAAVSRDTYAPGVKVAYIANGTTFPDALAGAAAAGTQNSPVLLTKANALPTATINELKRLKPQKIVVLGSNGVITQDMNKRLAQYPW
ncbi:cell wall-binding repeat-containing protein [Arthrobacter sp. TMP15]|uniref:cell wall-binding repeat-containing protein n=1 Tax=Arthrobacter sp. TMP15 TaxID=3140789 RepID=UPI0031BA0961